MVGKDRSTLRLRPQGEMLISCKKPINNCIGYDKHKTSNDKCKSIGIKERS